MEKFKAMQDKQGYEKFIFCCAWYKKWINKF